MIKSKTPTIKQLQATNKAYSLRGYSDNDDTLAKSLKLSKVTFYTRLRESNWKDQEIIFIEYLSNKDFKKTVDSLKII